MTDPLPPPVLIDDARAMRRLAERLDRQPAIAVDCEANTLFAYEERLCLLQISIKGRDYLVDPFSSADIAELAPVFADPAVMKVFHSAEYDVMLLKKTRPCEFRGLFDTKVAALSLGVKTPGLASVLADWIGVEIDKKYQRSDWGRRPLSEGQMDYARRDTHYLIELASQMRDRLLEAGSPHVEEVASECRRLEALQPEWRSFEPDDWVKIKGAGRLGPAQRRALRELSVMRNEIARERDMPLFKVLTSEMLLELATAHPRDVEALRRSRILPPKLVARHGDAIVDALQRAHKRRPIHELPQPARAPEDELSGEQRLRFDALRRWRKRASEERGTDPSLILSRAALLALSRDRGPLRERGDLAASGVLEGWRIEHYGEAILAALGAAAASRG